MIYALLAFNAILICALLAHYVVSRRDVVRERAFWAAREDARLERTRVREDQLIQRIQAPGAAIAQTTAEHAASYSSDYPAPYIGAFDDEAAAQYEQDRARLELETRALVESVELAEPVPA